MIKPDYVNFEQAKLLYEKTGLTREHLGFKHGSLMRPYFTHKGELNGDCLDHITKLLAKEETFVYACPEHWQVVEWLKSKLTIWVSVHLEYCRGYEGYDFNFEFINDDDKTIKKQEQAYKDLGERVFDSPQEAYSAAFTYILNELI